MRIFITAGGTVTAQSLVKALRADPRTTFVAVGDMELRIATKAFVDQTVRLPGAGEPHYGDACLAVAERLQIDLFVPLIAELEFAPLIARRVDFAALGCALVAPDAKILDLIVDKLRFAAFLDEIGVPGPRTQAYTPELRPASFPVYLKPRRASGSVGAASVATIAMLHELAAGRADLIVQEFVRGREFTVDCFAAEPGRVVAAVPRERLAIKSGVSVKALTHANAAIEASAARVVEASGHAGAANVQGMWDGETFRVIEMNPRVSGTLALTTRSGINFGSLMLDLAQGKPLADRRGTHAAGLTMLRYWQEVYEDANGEVTVDDASFRAVVG